MSEESGRILVGVDGSAPSTHAVESAAEEAVLRGWALQLLYAHSIKEPYGSMGPAVGSSDGATGLPGFLAEREAWLAETHPGVPVRVTAVHENPSAALVSRSADVELTVVGARGRSLAARLVLGSVSRSVALHARSAVLVVRDVPATRTAPVSVGIDGSRVSHDVLAYAFEEAALRHLPLRVFHAWDVPVVSPYGVVPEGAVVLPEGLEEEYEHSATALLHDCVDEVRTRYPEVDVEVRALQSHPITAALDVAGMSSLLVLGTRGSGWFEGMLTGSVAMAAVREAACPVLVVPPHRRFSLA